MEPTSDTHPSAVVSVDYIVPTWRRPEYLRKCMASITAQSIPAAQVLVGLRADDLPSIAVAKEFGARLPVRMIEAKGVGVIGSMTSCLRETTSELVALVDDDVELPAEWLSTMLRHHARVPEILAAAGRDFLQDHPAMRRSERRVLDVGIFHWYGRLTGNHHRGGGVPRRVDILRGSNCLFKGDFLREVGFEQALRGAGAQVSWELALACHAMRKGRPFFFDPTVEVVHHVAPRHDADVLHRGEFNENATTDIAFNETYVMARHAPGFRKVSALLFQLSIGSALAPGCLHALRQIMRADRHVLPRLAATLKGRMAAIGRAAAVTSQEDAA